MNGLRRNAERSDAWTIKADSETPLVTRMGASAYAGVARMLLAISATILRSISGMLSTPDETGARDATRALGANV